MTNKSSTRGTSPAFLLYAADLMSNRAYRMMNLAERGLLLSMLCECWVNKEVPAGRDELTVWLGKDVDDALSDRVLGFFKGSGSNLVSTELETYRDRVIERRNRMVEGGSKGGKRRAEKAASHPSSHPNDLDQATLKCREPEPEPEPEPESPSQCDELSQVVVEGGAAWC
jgi:hypothetical protein